MFKIVFRRSSSVKTPWIFNQTSPIIPTKPINPEKMYIQLKETLTEGFIYAFHSMCEAYEKQDTETLEQCLEPGLFKHILHSFNTLDSLGYKFIRTSSNDPEISLHNLSLTLGVNINRSLNLSKNDYIMIKSLEELKKTVPMDLIKSQVEKEGFAVSDSLLKSCLDYAWVYILPRAPANLVLSLDVIYNVEAPLMLTLNGKDV